MTLGNFGLRIDFQRQLTVFSYCLRVSKSWSKLLESMPNLWMDLDFSKAKRPLTLNTIRKYIKRGQGLATRATLPSFGSSAEGMPSYITKRCKNLEELSILKGVAGETILFASSYATNLKSLIMGQQCEVTMDCVHQLLYNCENLERAEFHYIIRAHAESWSLDMPKLQSLILSTSEVMKTPSAIIDVGALAQRIPNIRSLVLRWWATRDLPPHAQTQPIPDFSTLEKLETLDITGLRTEQIIRFPSNLCKLDLSRVAGSHAVVEEGQFKRLTWLSVEDSFCMTNNNLKRMLHANKGNLEYFNARYALSDGNYIVDLITAPYFTNTVEINFDYCDVSDAHGVVLCRYATNLKRATFQATRISGAGIGAMLRGTYGPCKLEYLCLNCCSNCSGDVVERARKMGIKTDYKFPVEQLKGRKIRGA